MRILHCILPTILCILTGCAQASFPFYTSKPFSLQLGRGSGWHGMDVVSVDDTGHTKLSGQPRTAEAQGETPSIMLSTSGMRDIADQIAVNKLLYLANDYSANVADGTQWVLVITQGTHRKVVYFDNNFPYAIKHFASALDAILAREGLTAATWTPGGRDLDKPLWQATEHRPKE